MKHLLTEKVTEHMTEILKSRGAIYTASIDLCHAVFLLGFLMSAKPNNILELGIGPGFASEALLAGIRYNGVGELTCLDNLHDLGGNLPQEMLDHLKDNGAKIVNQDEESFVKECLDNRYDFVVSDADHSHAGEWAEDIFRITQPNCPMFFHDVNEFPSLKRYKELADSLNKPNMIFSKSSREDENCHRGWMVVMNTK